MIPPEFPSMKSILKATGAAVLAIIILFLGTLATLAIYYSNLPIAFMRTIAAGLFSIGFIVAFIRLPCRRTVGYFFAAFSLVFLWWLFIPASNTRNWVPELATLAHAEFNGDDVTVHNIRNFNYRTQDEFEIRYYDKTFDLSKLDSVYFIVSHWDGNEAIAHTMLSFGFGDEDYLALSIEIRREEGEGYSGIKGLFRQYELIYVIADERDVIRLRTNYRGEDVYLYPLNVTPGEARTLLTDILNRANQLVNEPTFYRTLGLNCTTALVNHFNTIAPQKIRPHKKLLMNGYSDELAYERGRIDTDLPFPEAKKAHYISDIAKQYNDDPEFSRKIRAHLP